MFWDKAGSQRAIAPPAGVEDDGVCGSLPRALEVKSSLG